MAGFPAFPETLAGRRFGTVAAAGALSLALVGAFAGSAGAQPAPAAQPAATAWTSSPSYGTLRAAGVVTPAALPTAAGPSARTAHHTLPVLHPSTVHAAASGAPAPRAASTPLVSDTGRLVANFDGITAAQNKRVSGFDLEPPDEGLGASSSYVVNFVNVAGAVYTPHGVRIAGPFYLNTFFGEPATTNTSDPRVYYDSASQHWFATILEYSFTKKGLVKESHVDIAVSTTSNPTNSWHIFRLDTTNRAHFSCPCLADYPILGFDHYNVYVSTNEFTKTLAAFNGAQLYAVSKSQLIHRPARANYAFFPNLSQAGAPAYHVQPAVTYGSPGVEYLLSSLDPNATFDHRLGVWAVSNPQAVTTGRGHPALSSTVIGSEAYGQPPNAITPPGFCPGSDCGKGAPTTGIVQTDSDAMQEVQYLGGHLVGALNTAITVPGETGERAGVAYFDVAPKVSGGIVSTASRIRSQGYLAASGEYLLYPHLNRLGNGSTVMTFGLGGPTTFLSAAYAVMGPRSHSFGPIRLAAAGTGPDNGFTGTDQFGGAGRWGDYSGGQIIPGTDRVWLATQYIPNNGDGNANWGNRIFEIAG